MRWTFGVAPLDQTVTAARAMRRIAGQLLALERPTPELDRVCEELLAIEQRLAPLVPTDQRPRIGAAADGDGRVYVDHARDIGACNPCFPEYEIAVDGDRATGTVAFPIAYEGPPGVVHGGFLAVFFDCVIQHHNCDVGVAGKTTALSMRYRRPTPLGTDLHFTLERSTDERRITSTGQLLLDDDVLCEAEMRAVVGDRDALPAVSPRRDA